MKGMPTKEDGGALATATTTADAGERAPGKRGKTDAVHEAAARGLAGGGGALPFADAIQRSFGRHDVSGVVAHTDAAAEEANQELDAAAFASGDHVAFAGAPDLHTAAHEAAHVVQQRAGVHLKGGVGQAGDAYESHADAVADKVVRGESAEALLSEMAGPPGAAGGDRAVQFLGHPLDKPLPEGAEKPAHGEDAGKQRRYSVEQYEAMWEKEQGRKLTEEERQTIARGCIGITVTNLGTHVANPPLDNVFATFEQAEAFQQQQNAKLPEMKQKGLVSKQATYIIFAKMFWSNQDPDQEKRKSPDEDAYRPDPTTGRVDMAGYRYRAQPSYINFDYAFWDASSNSFWHANHSQPGMKVYQSTRSKFAAGYVDFDRTVYGVALAENYDPGKAAIAAARR